VSRAGPAGATGSWQASWRSVTDVALAVASVGGGQQSAADVSAAVGRVWRGRRPAAGCGRGRGRGRRRVGEGVQRDSPSPCGRSHDS
jgi:hypothetical protein